MNHRRFSQHTPFDPSGDRFSHRFAHRSGPHDRFGHGPGPHGPFGRGGLRAARGNVRGGILALLLEAPHNGYQIIQELGARSGGVWRPSSGSVYPALQLLEDEGLIRANTTDGKRAFELTDAGRAYCAEHPGEVDAPWNAFGPTSAGAGLRVALHKLIEATRQVARTGSDDQRAGARTVLTKARQELYGLLAQDEDAEQ